MSNLVINKVPKDNYETPVYEKAWLTYTTADGTQVKAQEAAFNNRSVKGVAELILANSMASSSDRAYAQKVVEACQATN